jgi:hypothetical protein
MVFVLLVIMGYRRLQDDICNYRQWLCQPVGHLNIQKKRRRGMAFEKQRLLVAVDGSQGSLHLVHYVAAICPPKATAVTLFHVLSPVAESYWDVETEPVETSDGQPVASALANRETAMEAFMKNARQVLRDSGFPDEAVRVVIQPRK